MQNPSALRFIEGRKEAIMKADLSNYPADKARGGEIILKKPWQRTVFMAGLAGAILLLLAVDLA